MPEPARGQLERAVMVVLDELRRRLGSAFTVEELADFYAHDVDWAFDIAQREAAGRTPRGWWTPRSAATPARPPTMPAGAPGKRLAAQRRRRTASALVVVRVVVVVVAGGALAGAADHDAIGLHKNRHGAVARPMLGVDGVVLDGGVEP